MTLLLTQLEIDRCPYCSVDKPNFANIVSAIKTTDHKGGNIRVWKLYVCQRCGGVVLAEATSDNGFIHEMYPQPMQLDFSIPDRARYYLQQAIDTQHAPDASVMACGSAIDAMLKAKGYDAKKGSLFTRINQAAKDHLITEEMAKWAHEIRLEANDQRHADEETEFASPDDAKRCVNFAMALAEFLFVLPSRVTRGLNDVVKKDIPPSDVPRAEA